MKQQLKKALLFMTICFIFGLSSCEKDLYEDQIQNSNRKIIVTEKSFDELFLESKFNQAFSKLPKIPIQNNSSLESRNAIEDSFGFTINPNKVRIIEKGDYMYYNFFVKKDSSSLNDVYNFVIKLKNNGEMEAFLTKYKDITLEGNNLINVTKEMQQVYSNKALAGSEVFCITVIAEMCNDNVPGSVLYGSDHAITVYCTDSDHWYTSSSLVCFSGGGGDGFTGGNGGPDNNEEVVTSPILLVEEEPEINPCAKLTTKTNEILFKNRMSNLNLPSAFSLDHETGFSEGENYATGLMGYTTTVGSGVNSTNVPYNAVGMTHVHNNQFVTYDMNGDPYTYISIPSPGDLFNFSFIFQAHATMQGLDSQSTYLLTIQPPADGSYAFMSMEENLIVPSERPFWNDFERKYKIQFDKLRSDNNVSKTNLQLMLLKLMKRKGLYDKVGLYVATNATRTSWSKLTLNASETQIIETPC